MAVEIRDIHLISPAVISVVIRAAIHREVVAMLAQMVDINTNSVDDSMLIIYIIVYEQ